MKPLSTRWSAAPLSGLGSQVCLMVLLAATLASAQPSIHPDERAAAVALGKIGGRYGFDAQGRITELAFGYELILAKPGDFDHIARLRDLKKLDLRGFGPSDLKFLAANVNLEELDLSRSSVGDAALASLKNLSKLRVLKLERSAVTDAGLAHLVDLPALEELYPGESFGDEGVAHVGKIKSLRKLDAGNAKISNDGLSHLTQLKNIDSITLYGTKVNDDGMIHLVKMTSLRHIYIGGHLTDAGLKELGKMTGLQTLWLGVNDINHRIRITDAGLAHLKDLQDLRTLSLNQTQVTGRGLAHLGHMKALHTLELLGLPIADDDLKSLRALPALRTLDLRYTLITDAGVPDLTAMQFDKLLVQGTKMTKVGHAALFAAFPKCHFVF